MRIFIFILCAIFANLAKAQHYLPMLTDGKEWHCMEDVKCSLHDGSFPLVIKVLGDTIVDGNKYKAISKEYTDSIPDALKRQYFYLAYEQDAKVYEYDAKSKESDILLDFSLHEGDVATERGDTIAEVDTIYCYGQFRRRLRLSNTYLTEDHYWVEGIGCNKDDGLVRMPLMSYSHESRIVACYDNGQLIFDEDCFNSPASSIKAVNVDSAYDGKMYDLSGKAVPNGFKGVCIRNGRKFIKR